MRWRQQGEVRWLEADLPGARAAFSTRLGGRSEPPFASLNLGLLTGDEAATVAENRARLAAALGLDPERVAIARQVHGAEIAGHRGPQSPPLFAAPDPERSPPELDGHHTASADLALLVFVADCLPIALSGPGGVAILHCGWRGLAGGIVGVGVAAVGAEAAAIGPGIGPCCYAVGDDVRAAFAPLGPAVSARAGLDLVAVARRLLERAGVGRIEEAGLCTSCNPELFYSHRGEGPRTGRQAGLVWKHR